MELFCHHAADVAEKSKLGDPIRTESVPSSSSLDSCVHLSARDSDLNAFDFVVRRSPDESVSGVCGSRTSSGSSAASRVSFVDEEFGPEPRHVVTQIRYRPRTTDNEKRELFYSSRDLIAFKKEVLYEKMKDKVREIKSGPVDAMAKEEVRELFRQAQHLCSYGRG